MTKAFSYTLGLGWQTCSESDNPLTFCPTYRHRMPLVALNYGRGCPECLIEHRGGDPYTLVRWRDPEALRLLEECAGDSAQIY